MTDELTHGMVAIADGPTTVTETLIEQITLPTLKAGTWLINSIYAQVVRATATPAEMIGGMFGIESKSGDMEPDPAPSEFPVFENGSFLGASAPASTCPLHKYEVDLSAAGKATLDLNYTQNVACTVAPKVAIGLSFGPIIPAKRRFRFCKSVRTTVASADASLVGTITLSQKATRITGIMGVLKQDGVLVTAEELIGIFSLKSDDIDLNPSSWLFNEVYGAGLGTVIGGGHATPPQPHIVDIPIPQGARIDCYCDLLTAVTNAADCEIFLFYE